MLNPIQLLAEISGARGIGYLSIKSASASWRIYMHEGELKYAECSIQTLPQLSYYLHSQSLKEAASALKSASNELPHTETQFEDASSNNGLYKQAIEWLRTKDLIDEVEAVKLLEMITQDSLESFFWLSEGTTQWVDWSNNPSLIETSLGRVTNFDLIAMVQTLQQRLKRWQYCTSGFSSHHQRPALIKASNLNQSVPSGKLSATSLEKLAQLMRGLSLRQIAQTLKQDELKLAQLLSPYVEHKIIYLHPPQSPLDQLPRVPSLKESQARNGAQRAATKPVDQIHKIVCIDDSPTILDEIQRFLAGDKFEVTAVDDPVKASSVIFRIKPDLILLDITMPRVNGYQLCALLRSSAVFNQTPIIMVTGNTGFIDKARSKLAGATDYLAKPFSQASLMVVIDKYLGAEASNVKAVGSVAYDCSLQTSAAL